MSQTSRERVTRCLKFEHPDRMPRQMWLLPWVTSRFPEEVDAICRRFPGDIGGPANVYRPSSRAHGDPYAIGESVDEWGCTFTGIQAGVVGEVRAPLVADLRDWRMVQPPYEMLPENPAAACEAVNRSCGGSELFIVAPCSARPWERLQFLRGSENAMVDVMEDEDDLHRLLARIHEYFLAEFEFWAATEVDALSFMDDWGSQMQLLIPPARWRELFKPLYREYCELAHASGKFIFMHSDGHIAEIYDDLIEIGVDALNSQLFCMDMADLRQRAKGRITFWGEIDRQHVLSARDPQAGRDAVRQVARHLYDPAGGIIAQFELGPGGNPAVAMAIFEEWEAVEREARVASGR